MNRLKTLLILITVVFAHNIFAQNLTQTVRGTVKDADSKISVIGATVMIKSADSTILGVATDLEGHFKFIDVPVGRIKIKVTSIGYQEIVIPNILVVSGKEKVIDIEMTEDITVLNAVTVTAKKNKAKAINNMVSVSAKTFTVEETNRYAGSLNDPARMVSAFAGVSGTSEGNNDIVVRGNSPRGILWRLEGIDIPNPNHFAGEGSTGGPVNSLNGSMLANSDFFSGAFAPEYGNALSGVFDVNFRKGNYEKREYSFSLGVLGVDGTMEGPFKKGYQGSYLVNYRYSSIALLDGAGVIDVGGIPKYQDVSFNLRFPTKKAGTFSLVGLGGISHILQQFSFEDTETVYEYTDFGAQLGVLGLKHVLILSPKVYIKNYIAVTGSSNGWDQDKIDSTNTHLIFNSKGVFSNSKYIAQSIINYKANKKNSFQIGATGKIMNYNFHIDNNYEAENIIKRDLESNGSSSMMQSFVSWKYRISNDLTLITGVHHMQFFHNNNYTIEPRLGFKWQISPRHDVSLGYGLHSKMESVSTYLYNQQQIDGSYKLINENLDFSKAAHYVAGYGFQLNENLHIKSEIYYQQLYNVPVSIDSTNTFSMINANDGTPNEELTNEGTGKNYGIELTIERFFHNNFYYLITGSFYESRYTSLAGVEYSSRFNANYAANLLLGKEFTFGKNKNRVLGFNTKVSILGAERYTPIDLAASRAARETVYDYDRTFEGSGDDIFSLNFGITYRVNKKRTSQSFKIDIQNLTNNKAVTSTYYNSNTGEIDEGTQLGFLPNIIYTITF